MMSLSSVSRRIQAIYEHHYADREEQRFENLYRIFDMLAAYVEASDLGAKIEIDYQSLAEIIRSHFLDIIRYKEYHFDPKVELGSKELAELGISSIEKLDPLSPEWARLVHSAVNINASKVAAYTVKWILRYKPISVISTRVDGSEHQPSIDISHPFLTSINEFYALHCAFLVLGVDMSKVSKRKIDELIYCFRFRAFDESAYFMILSEEYLYACKDR
jgi:DNA-binding transcriptional ArsR family regulator